jgi:uncharacterized repeat protein (TIGR03803 family)
LPLSKSRFLRGSTAVAFLCFLNLTASHQAFGYTETTLWSFADGADQGNYTVSGLIRDTSGNLYGTTQVGANNSGTAFELSPPVSQGGAWTYSVLHSFGIDPNDGISPIAGLLMDPGGNLYGTTALGGAFDRGTVFELSPPASPGGAWSESILWNFTDGADGSRPVGGLIMDGSGNLYGTTSCGGLYQDSGFCRGTVFKLSPPSQGGGNWTESILWNFGNGYDGIYPESNLIFDSNGNLYGTTACGGAFGDCGNSAGGIAFELMPPGGGSENWTEKILWNFGYAGDGAYPEAGLVFDGSGNLYGATALGGAFGNGDVPGYSGGTVFQLTPPSINGGDWTESILWSFGEGIDGTNALYSPYGGGAPGLLIDANSNLYGTTAGGGPLNNGGTAFELTPAGGGSWHETILWSFDNTSMHGDGSAPLSGLIFGDTGNFFGTTTYGGTPDTFFGNGTIFEITSGGPATPTPTPSSTPTPTPTQLSASPATLKFQNTFATGTSKPKKVTLTNKGTADAQIGSLARNAPFIIAGGPNSCANANIAPKGKCSFYVEFAPTSPASVSGKSIYVTYNGVSPALDLSGSGVGVSLKAPKAKALPAQVPGSVGPPKSIVFVNPSTVAVTLGAAMLGGSNPGSFLIASDQCSGQTVAPKSKCSVGVEFAPPGNASGTQSATLSLPYTYGANVGMASVSLSAKVK